MRKFRIALLACAALGTGLAASSAFAAAGITGSKHDFSATWGSGEICVACHAPHNTKTSPTGLPLWNHTITTQTFTPYTSSTFNKSTTVGGVSKLCLSCHDGVTAMDSYGTNTSGTQIMGVGGNSGMAASVIGTSLGNDHPIGFAYTPGTGYKSQTTLPMYSSNLECATCHNVHDDVYGKFLRVSNANSGLCTTCHDK